MISIKINKCSNNLYWYNRFVGCYVPFVREDRDVYWSRELAGYLNFIQKGDATVVDVASDIVFYKEES